MKTKNVLLVVVTFIVSCSPVRYFTYLEGGHDPLFNINESKTIGFCPMSWTEAGKKAGIDELVEKQMYVYARDELQKRGFKVFYISPDNLEQDTSNGGIYVKPNYKNMPDLTLTLFYWQGLGNKVQVPGQSLGTINWNNGGGGGYYGQTQGYEVQTYFLILNYALWRSAPKYMNKAWEGVVKKGSPKLDLHDQAPAMATEIFYRKFDRN